MPGRFAVPGEAVPGAGPALETSRTVQTLHLLRRNLKKSSYFIDIDKLVNALHRRVEVPGKGSHRVSDTRILEPADQSDAGKVRPHAVATCITRGEAGPPTRCGATAEICAGAGCGAPWHRAGGAMLS